MTEGAFEQISDLLAEGAKPRPREGVALCLSGGGYRAMLYHAGALLRLNEVGLLGKLDFVSSVSGGSLAAGVLARGWSRLEWRDGVASNLQDEVLEPMLDFAGRTVDVGSVLTGAVLPWVRISDRLVGSYEKHLFGSTTLQDLPATPRFIFCATNLQSGVLIRFSKRYLWDYKVGQVPRPRLPLALAVAASSAFPPVLSPVAVRLPADAWSAESAELGTAEFRKELLLSDGGVYDNLGLEPVLKRCATILVSDGGGKLEPTGKVASDWARHTRRVLSVIDQQVRNLRSRMLVEGYDRKEYTGAYWGIRTPITEYRLPDALPCPPTQAAALAATDTRLAKLPVAHRRRLLNWGYAGCDASVRRWYPTGADAPAAFPYPAEALG